MLKKLGGWVKSMQSLWVRVLMLFAICDCSESQHSYAIAVSLFVFVERRNKKESGGVSEPDTQRVKGVKCKLSDSCF